MMTQAESAKTQSHNCPICSSTELSHEQDFSHGDSSFSLLSCSKCGTQHWYPLEHPGAEYYEDAAQDMYEERHKLRKEIRDVRFLKFLNDFKSKLKSKKVLDIGCSDGLLLQKISQEGSNVWGIDIDRKAIEIAKARGLEDIYCESLDDFLTRAASENLKFDLIVMFDVLEHMTYPNNVLNSLKSILNDGGEIVGTVPNRNRYLVNRIKTDFPPHHFYRFSRESLKSLFSQCGYSVNKIDIFEYGYTRKFLVTYLIDAYKKIFSKKSLETNEKEYLKKTTLTPAKSKEDSSNKVKLSRQSARFLIKCLGPFSILIEYPLSKGFKLYFSIRK